MCEHGLEESYTVLEEVKISVRSFSESNDKTEIRKEKNLAKSIILIVITYPHCFTPIQAKTKKLCSSGNPTLPTILVPTLIFFCPVKKIKKNRGTVRYS